MSDFFVYICTSSTADPYIAPRATGVDNLARDVSDAFLALSGGRQEVGRLAMFPLQRSVAGHLLCDGREVPKAAFPELYAFLGDALGSPANPDNFVLPDYLGTFTPATVADTETESQGTVATPVPLTPSPSYNPDQSDKLYGDVDSGGRYRDGTAIP